MREGALIIQRIFVGPAATEAAVRVVEFFSARASGQVVGFSYVTLEGHAERGVATFFASRDDAGGLVFNIESWSRPAGAAAILLAPLSRVLQKRFTLEALAHFRSSVR